MKISILKIHVFIIILATSGMQGTVFPETFSRKEISPGLRENGKYRVWVYFTDKNESKSSPLKADPKTYLRRSTFGDGSIDHAWLDLDVSETYVGQIKETGIEIRHRSRWLNAVSVSGTFDQIESINRLPFIRTVEPVRNYRRKKITITPELFRPGIIDSTDYGVSWTQLKQLRIPEVHESGYRGENIRILVLDTGFDLSHAVFSTLKVVDEYDFINMDEFTADQTGLEEDSKQDRHGTIVLSILAANLPGQMLGAAYNSEYLLAKTEDVSDEYVGEEDNFVAGLEWGEMNGADILSASLGYIDWYSPSDLDGETAITTKAVNIATNLGMVCVVAAGNEGSSGIIAPADAFSVISVGAVNSTGSIASFSSVGPTYDGRIKPEVCAMGYQTWGARPGSDGFSRYNGTSLATPLISGALALVRQANPGISVAALRFVLLQNASLSRSPNNTYGWGIPDIYKSIIKRPPEYFQDAVLAFPNPVVNESDGKIELWYYSDMDGESELSLYSVRGDYILNKQFSAIKGLNSTEIMIKGLPSGVYFALVRVKTPEASARQIGVAKFTVVK